MYIPLYPAITRLRINSKEKLDACKGCYKAVYYSIIYGGNWNKLLRAQR